MKIAILAGGGGTRLSEETVIKPNPMVEIGCRPILWHIMMHYTVCGYMEHIEYIVDLNLLKQRKYITGMGQKL